MSIRLFCYGTDGSQYRTNLDAGSFSVAGGVNLAPGTMEYKARC